jgi:FKBP-type peptidyl-prolyl cis-trans isomerase
VKGGPRLIYLDAPGINLNLLFLNVGLDLGIEGMCIGEARRLLIPADLAYGEMGLPGTVESGTDLMYEVELVHSTTTFT